MQPACFWLKCSQASVLTALLSSALAQVNWIPKLDQAMKIAESEGKLVVVDVTASWCPPCQKMDRDVYPSQEFIEFSRSQVFLRLDADNDPEGQRVASRYKVQAFPTLLVLNTKGEEIQRLTGGRSARQLIEDLTAIFQNPEPLKQLIERAKASTHDFRLQYRAGERCLEQRDLSRAIQFLTRATSLAAGQSLKDRVGLLVSLSDACFKDGKYADALKAHEELEKLDPAFSEADSFRLRKGRLLVALNRHEEASRLIHETLKLSRSSEDKAEARELMVKLPGKYRQADRETAKALEKAGGLLKSKKFAEALELARQVANQTPWAAEAQMLVSSICLGMSTNETDPSKQSEQLSRALLHLRLARQLEPDNLHYYQESKLRLASRYIPLNPATQEARKLFEKAEACFVREQYRDAVEFYKKTIELEPGFGKAYLHLGDCFFANNQFEEALTCYQSALARTPLDASAHRFTADALSKLGRNSEATQYVYSCLLADPEYPLAWKLLERLASSNGKSLERHHQIVPLQFLNLSMVEEAADPSLFETVPEATVPAWQEYAKAKIQWRQELFKKHFPSARFHHSSFNEEKDCLEKLLAKWEAMKKLQPGLEDEGLDFLMSLDEEDSLDGFVFLELFTEEYRGDFEKWKKDDKSEAMAYVNDHLLGLGGRRETRQVRSSTSQNKTGDLFDQALQKTKEGATREVMDLYRRILELEPNLPEALHNLSLLLLKTGDRAGARQTLEHWSRVAPESAMALALRAQLEHQDGNAGQAARLLKRAIELESDPTRKARYEEILSTLTSDDRPISSAKAESKLDASRVRATLKQASDAIWDGKAEEAVEVLEELLPSLQGTRELDEALLLMGTALLYADEPIRAREYLESFLQKHPQDPKALELLEKTKLKRNSRTKQK